MVIIEMFTARYIDMQICFIGISCLVPVIPGARYHVEAGMNNRSNRCLGKESSCLKETDYMAEVYKATIRIRIGSNRNDC